MRRSLSATPHRSAHRNRSNIGGGALTLREHLWSGMIFEKRCPIGHSWIALKTRSRVHYGNCNDGADFNPLVFLESLSSSSSSDSAQSSHTAEIEALKLLVLLTRKRKICLSETVSPRQSIVEDQKQATVAEEKQSDSTKTVYHYVSFVHQWFCLFCGCRDKPLRNFTVKTKRKITKLRINTTQRGKIDHNKRTLWATVSLEVQERKETRLRRKKNSNEQE